MKRLCVLVTRHPESHEGADRVFKGILHSLAGGAEVGLYLLGDGVLLARDAPMGEPVRELLAAGAGVAAGSRDLEARGITAVVSGVEAVEDLEGAFLEDAMERAGKVITW